MTLGAMPLNRYADLSLNVITNETKQIQEPYTNVSFNNQFTATVTTESGVQSVTLNYVKNSKRLTPGNNFVAVYAYTLDQGVNYTYVYLVFKPVNNKLFMWKYPHANSGVGVTSTFLAASIVHSKPSVQLAYYRLIKRADSAVISADPAAPNSDEIFEVNFKASCVAVTGVLQTTPVASGFNNVLCFAQGPAFWNSVKAFITDAGVTKKLVKGVDYYAGYQFVLATRYTKEHVVGALVFDQKLKGLAAVSYSALGGDFGITQAHITALNGVIGEPADTNYEMAIRHSLSTPLIINAWPSETLSSYNTAIKDKITASGVSVSPYVYTV